jgi:hypothetical protein
LTVKLQVSRMAQLTADDAHFRLAFRLLASDQEQDVMRTYHLMEETIGRGQGAGNPGWTVSAILGEDYVWFETSSVEDAMAVEEALKNGCQRLAATMARLPVLASKFDGDDEYEF